MNVYFEQFKHLTEGNNSSLAMLEALSACKDGDTLVIGGGELHFYNEHLFEKEYYISNNDYSMKSILFPIIGKKNIVIDGGGCKMIFHGRILPFVIDKSENITIKNLTVDYAEPMYFEALIVDSGEDFVLMKYDTKTFTCDIEDGKFVFSGEGWRNEAIRVLVTEFNAEMKAPDPYARTYIACLTNEEEPDFLRGLFRFLKASKPAPDMLRLEGDIKCKHNVGNYWLCTHNDRANPGIFVNESKDVTVQNVTLNHTISMGVICQMTENITLDTVVAVPTEGRMLSVDADATHFVNCSGTVHMKNCRFESMMDDACNVHGIYMPIEKKLSENRLLLRLGHFQQLGVNIFRDGDRIRFVDDETLCPYHECTVSSTTLLSGKYLVLETVEKLPEVIPAGHVIENHTRMPYFHAENCVCGYNRPRGFLIRTCKGALVENCQFHNMYSGISMGGSASGWYESGPSDNVIIRNNDFTNAAYAGGCAIGIGARINNHVKPYHNNITIEGNLFRMHEKRVAEISYTGNVIFRNNTFVPDSSLPAHPDARFAETGICVSHCDNADIEPLKE